MYSSPLAHQIVLNKLQLDTANEGGIPMKKWGLAT